MKLLVTIPKDSTRARLLSPSAVGQLERSCHVRWNDQTRQFTPEELRAALADIEICMTGWGTPRLEGRLVEHAGALRLVVHVGGTVAPIVSDELYRHGVTVCSGNRVIALHVAEGVLSYTLAALRGIPYFDRAMHNGSEWPRELSRSDTLLGKQVGFVGLGTVGRFLLDLLRPFGVSVHVYDPYLGADALGAWPFARVASLDAVLAESTVISVHASLTEETVSLLDSHRLQSLCPGALLINTSRGAIIDQQALVDELRRGRIRAVLDVFTEEPLPKVSPLREMENVILVPHMAGASSHSRMGQAMVDEVDRFVAGRPLHHEVPFEQYRRMTRFVTA